MIIDFIPNEETTIVATIDRVSSFLDFWSEIDPIVTVTATALTQSLPSIVVTDIPCCSTINHVTLAMKYRAVENSSSCGSNNLVVACGATPHVQVDICGGGSFVDGIKMVCGMSQVATSSRDGGDVWVGDIDLASEVTGNATYVVQWECVDASRACLLFRDVQVGLRVYFSS